MYYRSVGRNCNLLLNATPGPDGLIPEANLRHYAEFGREIRRRFETPLAETSGEGEVVELKLPRPRRSITSSSWRTSPRASGCVPTSSRGWSQVGHGLTLCDGISIGHKRIQQFDPREICRRPSAGHEECGETAGSPSRCLPCRVRDWFVWRCGV